MKTGLSPPIKYFYWPFQGGTFLWIIFVIYVLCLLCFRVSVRSLLPAVWSPGWNGLISLLLFVMFVVIYYFPIWYTGTGVVLDCIDS